VPRSADTLGLSLQVRFWPGAPAVQQTFDGLPGDEGKSWTTLQT
jgi:hypothetical protein